MSFPDRDRLPGRLAALVLTLLAACAVSAEEPPAPVAPEVPRAECRDPEGKLLAPVDCAEFAARLDTLAKVEEQWAKVVEARKKREDLLRPPAPRTPPAAPAPIAGPAPAAPAPPQDTGRVLEIFGDQARVRWRGGEYLVRAGQRLPDGAWIVQVSLDGVTVADGRERRVLPFVIGRQP